MNEHPTVPQVVVIGGGYAGAIAANRLRSRDDIDITLVNPRPQFVERIRLHQLVAGTGTATVDYDTLLGAGIRRITDTAVRVDAATSTVLLASGETLHYDHLVYAVGSTGAPPASVPGAVEYALPLAELEYAERLRAVLDQAPADAPVTVVGAGPTGVETAAELAERGRPVTLVAGGALVPTFSTRGRAAVARWMRRHHVDVRTAATVTEVRPDAVVLDDGAVIDSAVTVWTAGFGVPDLAARSGLRTDGAGRLLTDATLAALDDPRIVAAGDAAAPAGQTLRMSCQAAVPLGAQAADTVLAHLAGTAAAPVDQAFVGTCTSLGRRGATIQLARRDDTPVNHYVGGRVGASIKEAICRGTVWSIRQEAQRPGATRWLRSGRSGRAGRNGRSGTPTPRRESLTA